jgi:hypothetical protein
LNRSGAGSPVLCRVKQAASSDAVVVVVFAAVSD